MNFSQFNPTRSPRPAVQLNGLSAKTDRLLTEAGSVGNFSGVGVLRSHAGHTEAYGKQAGASLGLTPARQHCPTAGEIFCNQIQPALFELILDGLLSEADYNRYAERIRSLA